MTYQRKEHELFIEQLKQLTQDLHFNHLNTTSYAQHMALGFAYNTIQGMEDEIIETLIGYAGRFMGYKLTVPSVDITACPQAIITIGNSLRELATKNKWNDLVNTSDEIVGVGSKLKYLLTLN